MAVFFLMNLKDKDNKFVHFWHYAIFQFKGVFSKCLSCYSVI